MYDVLTLQKSEGVKSSPQGGIGPTPPINAAVNVVLFPAAVSRECEQWEGVQDRGHLQALLVRYGPHCGPQCT